MFRCSSSQVIVDTVTNVQHGVEKVGVNGNVVIIPEVVTVRFPDRNCRHGDSRSGW